jgi:hypothetical protein
MDLSVEGRTERVPPGSHIPHLYNRVAEITGVTARLFEVGLPSNEKCLFAASPASVEELRQLLAKQEIDVAALEKSGQLVFIEDPTDLLDNGRFDPYHLLSTHQTFIAQALREGWKAVRIAIDMTWLTKDDVNPDSGAKYQAVLKYEAAADAVFTFQNAPIVAIMHYDYAALPGGLVVELLKLHPLSVVGKYIKRNPYYVNSEQYLLKILRSGREKSAQGGRTQ